MTVFQISLMILLFISFSLYIFTLIYALYCKAKETPKPQIMKFIIISILAISIVSIFFAIVELFI